MRSRRETRQHARLRPTSATAVALVAVLGAGFVPSAGAATWTEGEPFRITADDGDRGKVLRLRCTGPQAALLNVSDGRTSIGRCNQIRSFQLVGGRFAVVDLRELAPGSLAPAAGAWLEVQDARETWGTYTDDLIGGSTIVDSGAGNDIISSGYSANGKPFTSDLRVAQVRGGAGVDEWRAGFEAFTQATRFTLDAARLQVTDDQGLSIAPAVDGIEAATVRLEGDNHVFDASAFPGVLSMEASGQVTLIGTPGPDVLMTQGGNDTITGGGGPDTIGAGAGDDVVEARDGVADSVDCGDGYDTVRADAVDTVVNCETVVLPPPLIAPTSTGTLTTPAPVVQPPETSAIAGPKKVRKPRKAKFTFTSATPGATFMCRLDKRKAKPCTSPYRVRTKKLKQGKHRLWAWAVLGADADPVPSRQVFKVVKRKGKGPKHR
ncbi:calcium-binding protein [Nocardioides houyundeii]|uniref:calcium-binding protein n=1 Tax=Nocardioides houyundeii TaxID=2045452 RepID=UPI0013157DF1|nr:calcium-binding protein [Nocardioides houyundeii]